MFSKTPQQKIENFIINQKSPDFLAGEVNETLILYMNTNKRPIPNHETLVLRRSLFQTAESLIPLHPSPGCNFPIGLESGNKKTGVSGKMFDCVFVWNLPLRVTCPGASIWCSKHCYNSDGRRDVYPIEKWQLNWWWTIDKSAILKKRIIQQLNMEKGKRVAVRFHSCGDFYSDDYIDMWHEICETCQEVSFWGYTRSWVVPELLSSLTNLRSLKNVSLFASWDVNMPNTPSGWNRSIVALTNEAVKKLSSSINAYSCPEQYNKVKCCADCALCSRNTNKDIIFILH